MNKIEWLKLLHDKKLLWNDEAFTLTEQDKQDGLTSVDEKIDMEFTGEYGDNYAEVKDGRKLITIMKGQEGVNEFVLDKIRYMESDDLVNLIRQMPGGLKSVLESAWNWKLQDDGEYVLSIANTMASLNVPKLLRLADHLDKKGLFAEANELDSLVVAHCGHCDSDKKKMKKKKAAQLALAMVKKALELGNVFDPGAFRRVLERFERNEVSDFSPEEVTLFVSNIKNKSPREMVEYLHEHQDEEIASRLIEFLARVNFIKDPVA